VHVRAWRPAGFILRGEAAQRLRQWTLVSYAYPVHCLRASTSPQADSNIGGMEQHDLPLDGTVVEDDGIHVRSVLRGSASSLREYWKDDTSNGSAALDIAWPTFKAQL
jgi:hypothetical protein